MIEHFQTFPTFSILSTTPHRNSCYLLYQLPDEVPPKNVNVHNVTLTAQWRAVWLVLHTKHEGDTITEDEMGREGGGELQWKQGLGEKNHTTRVPVTTSWHFTMFWMEETVPS